jgi:hypothetical protein
MQVAVAVDHLVLEMVLVIQAAAVVVAMEEPQLVLVRLDRVILVEHRVGVLTMDQVAVVVHILRAEVEHHLQQVQQAQEPVLSSQEF